MSLSCSNTLLTLRSEVDLPMSANGLRLSPRKSEMPYQLFLFARKLTRLLLAQERRRLLRLRNLPLKRRLAKKLPRLSQLLARSKSKTSTYSVRALPLLPQLPKSKRKILIFSARAKPQLLQLKRNLKPLNQRLPRRRK